MPDTLITESHMTNIHAVVVSDRMISEGVFTPDITLYLPRFKL